MKNVGKGPIGKRNGEKTRPEIAGRQERTAKFKLDEKKKRTYLSGNANSSVIHK